MLWYKYFVYGLLAAVVISSFFPFYKDLKEYRRVRNIGRRKE